MAEKNALTRKGKEDLELKLQNLTEVEMPKANDELNFARSQGDLSENSDYDAAKEKFENIKAEIARIKYILDHHTIIEEVEDEGGEKTARLGGGEITVLDLSRNKEHKFTIVGSVEANPLEQRISNTCPVAQAIIGHKVGETVTVNVKNPYKLKIVNIA
jgi:transcription elongation factor GreA